MEFPRGSGIIAHPTSFPGPHGVGDLGSAAWRFLDWLARGRQAVWQVLPLVPVGSGNSPYSGTSAFAGNPILISLEGLVEDGLLSNEEAWEGEWLRAESASYEAAAERKLPRLQVAFSRLSERTPWLRAELEQFRLKQASWLDDYCLFVVLKAGHGGAMWTEWPEPLALRHPDALAEARRSFADEIEFQAFLQLMFRRQWLKLRKRANDLGIRTMGDAPIFVAPDSADVWSNQRLFKLNAKGRPRFVAGVPPDYFAKTGQLWGNPLYDWDQLRAENFGWWVRRVRAALELTDLVRLDHFRGFAACWEVSGQAKTAERGRWVRVPGGQFFEELRHQLGDLPLIAEDLGVITPDVDRLRERFRLPGMKVLQFGFDGSPTNPHLPHNVTQNTVYYTGTHDNDTAVGWWYGIDDWVRSRFERYYGRHPEEIGWDLVRMAWGSVAQTAMTQLQDLMGLGGENRMNMPGEAFGNWGWRYRDDQLTDETADRLADITEAYGRVPTPETAKP